MNNNSFGIAMEAKGVTRREREREARKQEVLEITVSLFAERGFHNVSMQEIAEAAEFAVGTLYNLFDSKEAMFNELFENCTSQIKDAFLTILEGPGTEAERLSRFILSQPDILEKHAEFIKLYMAEMGQRHNKLSEHPERDKLRSIINTALTQMIAQGIQKGLFRAVDPYITARAISSLLETMAFEMGAQFDKGAVQDEFYKVEQLFLNGLLLRG
jgi:AcrR family transcriptional regulator